MPRIPYYLVCHDTRTKIFIGSGDHTLDDVTYEDAALADFLKYNVIYTLVIEHERQDILDYTEYTNF